MRHQRGLSLAGVAIAMGAIALAAILGLMSWRSERNLFGEAWASLAKSTPLLQAQQAATTAAAPPAPIRKCTVSGKVVYSNVECANGAASSRAVDLQDTHGIEAPKVPPASEAGSESKDKITAPAMPY